MSDIHIVAHSVLKPECRDAFLQIMKEVVPASREEAGNKRYELVQDMADPNSFCVIEIWRSEKAIEEHGASPHFQKLAKFFSTDPGELKITQFTQVL